MTEEQRQRWRTLAVFPATFAQEAAAAVWQVGSRPAQNALKELVVDGLLEWEKAAGRYRLHDLVRKHAKTYLTAQERREAQRSHAIHYGQVMQDALEGEESHARIILHRERANTDAAHCWADRNKHRDKEAARLCEFLFCLEELAGY